MNILGADIGLVDPPARFEQQFRGVLDRLPIAARNGLVQFWSQKRPSGTQFKNCIVFPDELERNAYGVTKSCGRTLCFRRGTFEAGDAQFCSDVIAHELAHVYDWAVGAACKIDDPGDMPPEAELQMECDAIRIAAEWGFSLPGGRTADEHLKLTAAAILAGMPLEVFPEHHPSRLLLLKAVELGSMIASCRALIRGKCDEA